MRRAIEKTLLQDVIRAAYRAGGDLADDERLIEFCRSMLATADELTGRKTRMPSLKEMQFWRAAAVKEFAS